MANKLRKWASRRRSLILVVGLLLVIGVLVLVVVGALWWKGKRDAAGQTNPVLVDADPSGGEGVVVQEVEVGLPGGGAAGAGGGEIDVFGRTRSRRIVFNALARYRTVDSAGGG